MRDLLFYIIHWRKIRRARRFIHSKDGEEWNKMLIERLKKSGVWKELEDGTYIYGHCVKRGKE